MAKVEHRKARKDYPEAGIAKGDMYYYAQIKTGPRSSRIIRQKAPIKPQQLTSSEYLSALYTWQEQQGALDSMDGAQDLANEIRSLGEEQQAKYDNMPEGLQQGDTGQMIEARAQACEAAASEIEDIVGRWESARDEHDDKKAEYDKAENAVSAAETDEDQEEAQEELDSMEDPGEFEGEDDFIAEVQAVEVSE